VEVILDVFDLKEGHDKYAFMEKMVTDSTVTHVLVFSDKSYAEKADARAAGVGTESQIISREVYERVDQAKFIPIVCERADNDEPFLPAFLKGRIWIDFSSPEAANANWERLLRVLYGRPLLEKPPLGKPPAYLAEQPTGRASPAFTRFNALRQVIVEDRKGRAAYRQSFLTALLEHADGLRVRKQPNLDKLGAEVLETYEALRPSRNLFIDWVALECSYAPAVDFASNLQEAFERLLELKARPAELNSYNDAWFEAHSLFAYEIFLYTVAALLNVRAYSILHDLFHTRYLKPLVDRTSSEPLTRFDAFLAFSQTLQAVLAPPGRRLHSPAAALLERNADRPEIPFRSVIEADLVAFLMGLVLPDTRWIPQTLYYAGYGQGFPFFLRATQKRHFTHLSAITDVPTGEALRAAARKGLERLNPAGWSNFPSNAWTLMNMDQLDTLP